MRKRIKVKPASPDLVVLDELGRRIPSGGCLVNLSVFIKRRIDDGDLIDLSSAKIKTEAEKPTKKGGK